MEHFLEEFAPFRHGTLTQKRRVTNVDFVLQNLHLCLLDEDLISMK